MYLRIGGLYFSLTFARVKPGAFPRKRDPYWSYRRATSIALVAVLVGVILYTKIPTQLGVYRSYAKYVDHSLVGFTPAFHYGIPWKFTFEELYASDLTGQTALITGANKGYVKFLDNSGLEALIETAVRRLSFISVAGLALLCTRIGYETSLALARLGARVVMACRSPTRCQDAADRIRGDDRVKGEVITMTLDTSSLASVKAFAEAYDRDVSKGQALDMLFMNAGVGWVPFAEGETGCVPLSEDGIEKIFATNYVGHHLLYRLLEPRLRKSKMARIIQTSSNASFHYRFEYGVATDLETLNSCYADNGPLSVIASKWYAQSKLAQIVWAKALTRRLGPDSNMFVNAFHPGLVGTSIWNGVENFLPGKKRSTVDMIRSTIMWTPEEGALTGLFLAVAVDTLVKENIRGRFYHPQGQENINAKANDENLQDALWKFSDELVKDFLPESLPSPA